MHLGARAKDVHQAARARAGAYLEDDYIPGVSLEARLPIVVQSVTFLADFYDLVERWAGWAADVAESTARADAAVRSRLVLTEVAAGRSPLPRPAHSTVRPRR